MKTKSLTFIIILFLIQTISAQIKTEQLIGTWESFESKSNVEIEIPITELEGTKSKKKQVEFFLKFGENNKMDMTQFGVPYKAKYKLKDSILTMGNRKYIISTLTKELLTLKDFDNLFSKETHYRKSNKKIKIIKEFEEVIENFPNGKLKLKGKLHNGFDHGKWNEWYENGQKKSEKFFINGIPTGTWKEWDKNGKVIKSKKMN